MMKLKAFLQIISISIVINHISTLRCNYCDNCESPSPATNGNSYVACVTDTAICPKDDYTVVDTNLYGSLASTSFCGDNTISESGCNITYSCCFTDFCNVCPSQGCSYKIGYEPPSSTGKIVGIVVGVIVGVLVLICCCCYCFVSSSKSSTSDSVSGGHFEWWRVWIPHRK